MRPITLNVTYGAATADAIAQDQTLAAAGSLTLDGSLVQNTTPLSPYENAAPVPVAFISPPSFVTIVSTNDLSLVNFTVTGTDSNGRAITEVVVGPNNATVTTTNTFATVSSVSADAAAAGVSAGVNSGGNTSWIPLDIYVKNQVTDIQVTEVSGTMTYSMVYTNDDPFDASITHTEVAIDSTLTSATTSINYQSTKVMRAVKLKVASGSEGSLRVVITQQSIV